MANASGAHLRYAFRLANNSSHRAATRRQTS
ncbi:hypothetical protein BGLA2_760010 [Burkholderia gladioli]|nr:hypothetical protein BGLA2_760010 [Burkholderia gladioli]